MQSEGADVFFEMEAPFEPARQRPGRAVSGTLTIDPSDLAKSRGLVNVDITELEIYMQRRGSEDEAYGEREKNENQNKHMRLAGDRRGRAPRAAGEEPPHAVRARAPGGAVSGVA